MIKKTILIGVTFLICTSCTVVQEYEKININDPEMALSPDKMDRFESNFQSYREGASGGNGSKSGGGCGCN